MKKSKNLGFTLVELVIVIAIVIVLSVASVPIYRNYVDKAKMAEGYALLGTILSAQKTYYSEHGNFLLWSNSNGWTGYDQTLGIDARGNKYYTWFQIGASSNYGGSVGDMKYSFAAGVVNPPDFGGGQLYLQYNITRGTKMSDKFDHDWGKQ